MSNKEKHSKDKATEDLLKAAEEVVNEAAEGQQAEETTEKEEPTEVDKVQEMGEKLAELNDKYLRLYSEYENYRKRTNQEKADLLINGSREMMKAILPVIDDFERALAATEDEGVQLIYNKMMKILEQKGLKAMEVKGEKFDENLHEAITRIPAPEESQKGLVMDVVEKGYYLNDKVLRYAKVVVAF
jgi:molecular chaperone GrpE